MEIATSVLALLISILSLALSWHTGVTTRQANQLQRLAGIRTKLSSLMWKIQFDLSQYERFASILDQLPSDEQTTWTEDISYIKETAQKIEGIKSQLETISSVISAIPVSLGAGQTDEIEHRVDSISEGLNLASEKLLPRMAKLAERELKGLDLTG